MKDEARLLIGILVAAGALLALYASSLADSIRRSNNDYAEMRKMRRNKERRNIRL
jgi:hypothetical protein